MKQREFDQCKSYWCDNWIPVDIYDNPEHLCKECEKYPSREDYKKLVDRVEELERRLNVGF